MTDLSESPVPGRGLAVAILGAGGIGRAMAALLHRRGHHPLIWSPSGRGTEGLRHADLQAEGALVERFPLPVAEGLAQALAQASIVLIALPANGHRRVMDAALPHLTAGHTVIVSAQLSLGAAYLAQELQARGIAATVAAWGTTLAMGRAVGPAGVQIGGLRGALEMAVLPAAAAQDTLALCQALFGDCFRLVPRLLSIALGNLNPPVHLANVLCNLTRVERGEPWANYHGITPAVSRLIEALDAERLALAAAHGLTPPPITAHFARSFDLPADLPLAEMAARVHARRGGPPGPTSLETRYITEDVPFGIAEILFLAARRGLALPLHQAGLTLMDALCGRDFAAENDLLPALTPGTLEQLEQADFGRENPPGSG
jgi:opine dehydrogenase